MTVPISTTKVTYRGNEVAYLWDIPFNVTEADHVRVYITDETTGTVTKLDLSDGYTVSLDSMRVQYPASLESDLLPATKLITIRREVEFTQDASLTNQGGLYPKTIETVLDNLTMMAQELKEETERSVKAEISSSTNPEDLIAEIREAVVDANASASSAAAQVSFAAAQVLLAQAQVALAEGQAELALGYAQAAAASAALAAGYSPTIHAGDAGKAIIVNGTENGFILANMVTSFLSLTDSPDSFVGFEKKGVRVNSAGTALEFANSASNLVLIGHSNTYTCTSDTSYASLLDMRFILDPMRTQKILKFAVIEKGDGNCRITVTDGTTSVNVVGANGNSASYAVRELELDCSTLSSSILWTITVEGIAVSGEYEMRRFSCQADPANILGGYPLILSDPGVAMNSATATVVDTKYFPVNWAIDNQCIVHAQGLLTLNSGTTATVKVRLTTSKDAETTFEEQEQTITATGYFDLLIPFPSIVAPYVKTEVFLSTDGMVTLEHFEQWLEV